MVSVLFFQTFQGSSLLSKSKKKNKGWCDVFIRYPDVMMVKDIECDDVHAIHTISIHHSFPNRFKKNLKYFLCYQDDTGDSTKSASFQTMLEQATG